MSVGCYLVAVSNIIIIIIIIKEWKPLINYLLNKKNTLRKCKNATKLIKNMHYIINFYLTILIRFSLLKAYLHVYIFLVEHFVQFYQLIIYTSNIWKIPQKSKKNTLKFVKINDYFFNFNIKETNFVLKIWKSLF